MPPPPTRSRRSRPARRGPLPPAAAEGPSDRESSAGRHNRSSPVRVAAARERFRPAEWPRVQSCPSRDAGDSFDPALPVRSGPASASVPGVRRGFFFSSGGALPWARASSQAAAKRRCSCSTEDSEGSRDCWSKRDGSLMRASTASCREAHSPPPRGGRRPGRHGSTYLSRRTPVAVCTRKIEKIPKSSDVRESGSFFPPPPGRAGGLPPNPSPQGGREKTITPHDHKQLLHSRGGGMSRSQGQAMESCPSRRIGVCGGCAQGAILIGY